MFSTPSYVKRRFLRSYFCAEVMTQVHCACSFLQRFPDSMASLALYLKQKFKAHVRFDLSFCATCNVASGDRLQQRAILFSLLSTLKRINAALTRTLLRSGDARLFFKTSKHI